MSNFDFSYVLDRMFEKDMKMVDQLNLEYESTRKKAYEILSSGGDLDEAEKLICKMEGLTEQIMDISHYWASTLGYMAR